MKKLVSAFLLLLLGAALPKAVTPAFVSNCEIVIRPPVTASQTVVTLATAPNAVTADVQVNADGLVRLRLPDSGFFVDEGTGLPIKGALQRSQSTSLTYTWTDKTRVVLSGTINGRPIRAETFVVGPKSASAPLLSRIGEDYAGAGRSAVRFSLFRKEVKFLIEDVAPDVE